MFGQARARILQPRNIIIKRIEISDSAGFTIVLSDTITTSTLEESNIHITLSDGLGISMELSDKANTMTIEDNEF
jgi:hypothetical protein